MKGTVLDIKPILASVRSDFLRLYQQSQAYKNDHIDSIAEECFILLNNDASKINKMTSIGNIAYDLDMLNEALTIVMERSNKWVEVLDEILGNLDNDKSTEDLKEEVLEE